MAEATLDAEQPSVGDEAAEDVAPAAEIPWPSDEFAPPQEIPAEALQPKPARERRPERARPAADWTRLAAEFGIEAVEPPAPAAPQSRKTVSSSSAEEERPRSDRTPRPPALRAGNDDIGWAVEEPAAEEIDYAETADSGFQEVEADDFTDREAMAADLPAEAGDAAEEESSERKGGRRRRKRRRRSQRLDHLSATDEVAEGFFEVIDDLPEEAVAAEFAEVEPPAEDYVDDAPASEEPGGRKRRRRRRGSRRRTSESEPAEAAEAEAVDFERVEEIPASDDLVADADEDDDDAESDHAEISHRGIPTWKDAVGIVIAANMDSRAKRPGGNNSRGRGRGRDRSH